MQSKSLQELSALIEDGLKKIIADGKFAEFLAFHSKFHKYSPMNSLLIFCACRHATMVAGLKQWNKLGRRVKKGEKAIMIFAPLIKKVIDIEVDCEAVSESKRQVQLLQGFRAVCVYDVSQTEGKELPEEADICHDFGGETELLSKFISVFGYKYGVKHEPLEPDLGGFLTSDNTITLNANKSEEQRLKTLIHEVAHGELNHFKEKSKSRAVKELEAEITSFIVSGHFGVDSSCYSFGYLAGWSDGDISEVKEALTVAYDMANSIIAQLEAAMSLPKAS